MRPNRRSLAKFLGICLSALVLSVSGYSLMIKIPLRQLVHMSEAIVIGRVQSIHCEWSLDKRLIVSIVKVRIQEAIGGELWGPYIVLEVQGGTVGGLSLKVTDMPAFHEQEEILIFLRTIKNMADTRHSFTVAQNFFPSYEVCGKAQGKYALEAGGLARASEYGTYTEEEDSGAALPLASLKAQIQSILREARTRKQRNR